MIFPGIVAVVAISFATLLARQYLHRRRPYQLVWTASLLLGAIACIAFQAFLSADRNETFFRLYYACGALLMAGYLGLGSIFLLAPRRIANAVAALVIGVSTVGIFLLWTAPLDSTALSGTNVEAGTHVISGPSIAFIIAMNTFGALAVVGGAAISAWKLIRRHGPAHLLVANVLIAAGTILASLAGTLARVTADGSYFWALLACGFVVLFAGFTFTNRRAM
jgi:hypothetical protein